VNLPKDIEELKVRLGLTNNNVMNLKQLQAAQEQLAEFMVEATKDRWPDAWERLQSWPSEARLEAVWAHANQRWPGVHSIAAALNAAERHILRGQGALA
jgi:hypothetical protein